jgi:protocatechuate 3,4-dioxygenase alpha subunit
VPELCTPSQTVGPFFAFGLCTRPSHLVVPEGSEGAIRISGRIVDGAGAGVPDAMVEIRQADRSGAYRPDFGWGRSGTDADGRFEFVTVKPGPVAAAGGLQAPHLVVLVFARGLLKALLTRMYFPDEPEANAADPVLCGISDQAERATLLARDDAGGVRFDIHLQGPEQTTFFAL